MGVYNPKKKMPTSCYMCWDSLYCEYKIKNPIKMVQGRADDCPLIEIPQEDEKAVLFLLRMRKATREGKSWREFLDEERRTE